MLELSRYQRLEDDPTGDDLVDQIEEEEINETKNNNIQGEEGSASGASSSSSTQNKFILKVISQEKSITITSLTPSSTISELKEKISQQFHIPINQQRLIYCGKPLIPDNKTLNDFKITSDCIIHLFPKLVASSTTTSTTPASPPPSSTTNGNDNQTLSPFHQMMMQEFNVVHHLPIHFDPEVGQSVREVKMWSYILVIISAMTLFSNLSFLGSTGRPGNGVFDGCLNVFETICSVCGLYVGQLGLKSSVTIDITTIRKYVYYLSILAVFMIIIRIMWVADVVILAKKDLKERQEDEQADDNNEEEEEDKGEGDPYDDYYGDVPQISDHNFIVYFAIQASIMALIVIAMWITCVSRAYHFRYVVESYEGTPLLIDSST